MAAAARQALSLGYEEDAAASPSASAAVPQSVARAAQLEEGDLLEDSKPRHECGVFGVWGEKKNASRVTFFALYALNHRAWNAAVRPRSARRRRDWREGCSDEAAGRRRGAGHRACRGCGRAPRPPRSALARRALHMLQHLCHRPWKYVPSARAGGQESAGIASYDVTGMNVHKGMGLVSQVFQETDIDMLKGEREHRGGRKMAGAPPAPSPSLQQ